MRSPVQSWVPLPSVSLSIRQTDFFLQDEIIPPLSRWDFLISAQQNLFVPSGLLERALALGTPEGLWPAALWPLYCSLAADNISILLSHDPPSGLERPSGLWNHPDRPSGFWNRASGSTWNARSASGPALRPSGTREAQMDRRRLLEQASASGTREALMDRPVA